MAKSPKSRYMILGLLADGPRTGYDIKSDVEGAAAHFWKESFGSIYPVLEQLRREGLVTVRQEDTGGRRRRRFALTPAGRTTLRRWLGEPVGPDVLRLELLLKLHVGGGAPPGLMIEHLERYVGEQEAFAAQLDGFERELRTADRPEPGRTYRRLTVRLGQQVAAARLRWARESIATLKRMPARKGKRS